MVGSWEASLHSLESLREKKAFERTAYQREILYNNFKIRIKNINRKYKGCRIDLVPTGFNRSPTEYKIEELEDKINDLEDKIEELENR